MALCSLQLFCVQSSAVSVMSCLAPVQCAMCQWLEGTGQAGFGISPICQRMHQASPITAMLAAVNYTI